MDLFGQNRLSISSTRIKSLDFRPSHRAGIPPNFLVDDSKWLNYTVLLDKKDPTCSISAQIVAGSIPDGIEIKLMAMPYEGPSRGHHGLPIGEITLSHIPQVIIDNIGTSYTGTGTRVGYQLVYYVEVKDFEKLKSGVQSLNILYTLNQ